MCMQVNVTNFIKPAQNHEPLQALKSKTILASCIITQTRTAQEASRIYTWPHPRYAEERHVFLASVPKLASKFDLQNHLSPTCHSQVLLYAEEQAVELLTETQKPPPKLVSNHLLRFSSSSLQYPRELQQFRPEKINPKHCISFSLEAKTYGESFIPWHRNQVGNNYRSVCGENHRTILLPCI